MVRLALRDMTHAQLEEIVARPPGHPDYDLRLSLGAREELALRIAEARAQRAASADGKAA